MKAIDQFVALGKEFVARVDAGEVRSRYTYNKMKAALKQYEEELHPLLYSGYGPFPGRKLTNDDAAGVTQFVESKLAAPAPLYGYCPICGSAGNTRERRLDGNDTCINGHTYKSSDAQAVPKCSTCPYWVDNFCQNLLPRK